MTLVGRSLLLSVGEACRFSSDSVEHAFATDGRFQNVQRNHHGGAVVEAEFIDGDDWTRVELSDGLDVLSFSGASDAALQAALIMRQCYNGPMRLFDTNYSFDVDFNTFLTVEELRAAMDRGQVDAGFWK